MFINFPTDYYRKFVIDKNFKMTKDTFTVFVFIKKAVLDTLLNIILYCIAYTIIIFLFNVGGEFFYIWAMVAMMVFLLFYSNNSNDK